MCGRGPVHPVNRYFLYYTGHIPKGYSLITKGPHQVLFGINYYLYSYVS